MKEGVISEDEVVNRIMGYGDREKMTKTQEKYRDKLKERIAQVCRKMYIFLSLHMIHAFCDSLKRIFVPGH
jgi:hypothetical protein